jgi:DNA-binding NarL/FixJ family response regulator
MPELDGLEATRRIIVANDSARILILTTFGLDESIYEALSAGPGGSCSKTILPNS